MKPVLYAKPSITELEIRYVADAIANGWGPRCNDYILRFEREFAKHLDVPLAMATASCTGALHLALAALGVGPGDEVVVPDITWIASVSPIVHLGATPVLVDVLPDTWCVDPDRVEEALTSRTKAVVCVHVYGNLCDMDRLSRICQERGVALIEDAAEGLGSEWKGRKAGSMGDFSIFSFHGTKTVTTGEGGMLCSRRSDLWDRVRTLSDHGRRPGEPVQFWCSEFGYKFKMSNLQAALGCAQLERIEELVARRREIFHRYRERLSGLPGLRWNPEPADTVNSYWMTTIVWDRSRGVDRDDLVRRMKENAIDARVFFHPVSSFPMVGGRRFENPVAASLEGCGLNLPCYHDLDDEGFERVCGIVEEVFG
ncbi:MAG TPA: DegT/DnrJ/EryC1/StrS aminotransferase family protein [Fibrobacteria bacterium]|nr:DegT/DnrJ/EryC1/StrS aminotransferase family protein [Fibrobacteria bacterium]